MATEKLLINSTVSDNYEQFFEEAERRKNMVLIFHFNGFGMRKFPMDFVWKSVQRFMTGQHPAVLSS